MQGTKFSTFIDAVHNKYSSKGGKATKIEQGGNRKKKRELHMPQQVKKLIRIVSEPRERKGIHKTLTEGRDEVYKFLIK